MKQSQMRRVNKRNDVSVSKLHAQLRTAETKQTVMAFSMSTTLEVTQCLTKLIKIGSTAVAQRGRDS